MKYFMKILAVEVAPIRADTGKDRQTSGERNGRTDGESDTISFEGIALMAI
jgi:hypothetical protein